MSSVLIEHFQPLRGHGVAWPRPVESANAAIRFKPPFDASFQMERHNMVREALTEHLDLVRSLVVLTIILLSLFVGLVIPQIVGVTYFEG